MTLAGPPVGEPYPAGVTIPRAVRWFWRHQAGCASSCWAAEAGVTVLVSTATHSWQPALWIGAAIWIVLGACYLAASASGIRRRRSAFAGLATILLGAVWSFAPNGGWATVAVLGPFWAVMFVAVILAARAADEDRRRQLLGFHYGRPR